jgi:hypothetical protein
MAWCMSPFFQSTFVGMSIVSLMMLERLSASNLHASLTSPLHTILYGCYRCMRRELGLPTPPYFFFIKKHKLQHGACCHEKFPTGHLMPYNIHVIKVPQSCNVWSHDILLAMLQCPSLICAGFQTVLPK